MLDLIYFRYGIEVIGFASDGDNRLLKAMKARMNFYLVPKLDVIQRIVQFLQSVCVQDSTHIGTKLKNRFLNDSIVLYIGNKNVSAAHIND